MTGDDYERPPTTTDDWRRPRTTADDHRGGLPDAGSPTGEERDGPLPDLLTNL
jgi:hypothetical protein